MKYISIAFLLIILTSMFSLSQSCFSKTYSSSKILILGNELDEYANINSYIKTVEKGDIEIINLRYNANLKYSNYDREIKVEIYSDFDILVPLNTLEITFQKIMALAIKHLKKEFVGIIVDKKLFVRILVCCIEFGMRFKNSKYTNGVDDEDCTVVLGLADGKKTWVGFQINGSRI